MFTGPSRSIFARSAAIASSALSARCSAATTDASGAERSSVRNPPSATRNPESALASSSSSGSSAADDAGVRRRTSLLFELLDLGDDLVERRVDRVLAGVRQVREIRFGGRPGDVQLGDHGANRIERAARFLDRRFERLGGVAQLDHRVAGRHHRLPEGVELALVGVELHFARGDRFAQLRGAAAAALEIGAERGKTLFQFDGRLLETPHLGRQRARALDQRRVRGARFGRAPAQVVGRLARLEQAALRDGQPLVGLPLLVVQPGDRRARFFLPAIEAVALVFRLRALARELFRLLREARSAHRRRAAAAPRSRRPPSPACDARR